MVSGTTPVVRRGPWLGAAGPDRFPCSSDEELVVFSVSSRTHEMEMDGSSVAAPSSGFCVLGASVLRGFAVMNRSIVVASDVVSTSRRGCTVEVTASFLLELFLCRRNIIFRFRVTTGSDEFYCLHRSVCWTVTGSNQDIHINPFLTDTAHIVWTVMFY